MTTPHLDSSQMDDDAFNQIVNSDIREVATQEQTDWLREPENLQRWYDSLLTMKRNLEYQFSTNRSDRAGKYAEFYSHANGEQLWAEWLADNEKWRVGALKFHKGVERRLHEAHVHLSGLRRAQNAQWVAHERDLSLREVARLRSAILAHKDSIDDDDATEYDDVLWAVVDVNS